MENWTLIHWLLLQFALLTTLGCVGFGIALQLSKSRLQRLQIEFKKLATNIAEVLASVSDQPGVQLDALLMQTEAYLGSKGLSISWREVDPLQYPELMPLFLRCSVLELEHETLNHIEDENYWNRLSNAFDQILFNFNKDGQASALASAALEQRVLDAEALAGNLQDNILVLEEQINDLKSQLMQEALVVSEVDVKVITEELSEVDTHRVLDDIPAGIKVEDANDFQVKMLSNIIEDQKARIASLQLQTSVNNAVITDKNSVTGHIDTAIMKALVEAWMCTEDSLIMLERDILQRSAH